jgi:hypothetical protein
VAWIQEHVNYAKAGLLIRILDDEKPRARRAKLGNHPAQAPVPRRQHRPGTSLLVNQVLQQILNSPR